MISRSDFADVGSQWSDARVIAPLVLAIVFFIAFLGVEIFVAPEPVMAPAMLRQRIPVLVSISNFLVGACNFSVTYFFPMWFQVVTLESASTAGTSHDPTLVHYFPYPTNLPHLSLPFPNSMSMLTEHIRRAPPDAEQCFDVHRLGVRGLGDAPHRPLQDAQSHIWDLPNHWRHAHLAHARGFWPDPVLA